MGQTRRGDKLTTEKGITRRKGRNSTKKIRMDEETAVCVWGSSEQRRSVRCSVRSLGDTEVLRETTHSATLSLWQGEQALENKSMRFQQKGPKELQSEQKT